MRALTIVGALIDVVISAGVLASGFGSGKETLLIVSLFQPTRVLLGAGAIIFALVRPWPCLGLVCILAIFATCSDLTWRSITEQDSSNLTTLAALSAWQVMGLLCAAEEQPRRHKKPIA